MFSRTAFRIGRLAHSLVRSPNVRTATGVNLGSFMLGFTSGTTPIEPTLMSTTNSTKDKDEKDEQTVTATKPVETTSESTTDKVMKIKITEVLQGKLYYGKIIQVTDDKVYIKVLDDRIFTCEILGVKNKGRYTVGKHVEVVKASIETTDDFAIVRERNTDLEVAIIFIALLGGCYYIVRHVFF